MDNELFVHLISIYSSYRMKNFLDSLIEENCEDNRGNYISWGSLFSLPDSLASIFSTFISISGI